MSSSAVPLARRGRLRRWLQHAALDVTPLRASRDYRLLFTGQLVSSFGTAISFVVLPWQLYQLTHSTVQVGLLGLVEFFPMLLLSLAGGALADSLDRRKLIIGAECALSLCCATLVINALLAHPRPWVLFVCSAWSAGGNALHRPALESLTPRLVAPEHLPAVSALSSVRSMMYVICPSIAGIIAARFGSAVAFSIDLTSYIVAIYTLTRIASIPIPAQSSRPSLNAILEGFNYARHRPVLLGTYLIDINAMFFAMPFALFPALAEYFGKASVGLFYSAISLGPLIVTLTSGWTTKVRRHGLAIFIAVLVWGCAIFLFGHAASLGIALACLVVAGAADGVSGIFRGTIWNQTIPDRLRGRMAGIEMVSYMSGPYLGSAQVGFSARAFGLRTGIAYGGAACVAGALLLAAALPDLVKYRSADPE